MFEVKLFYKSIFTESFNTKEKTDTTNVVFNYSQIKRMIHECQFLNNKNALNQSQITKFAISRTKQTPNHSTFILVHANQNELKKVQLTSNCRKNYILKLKKVKIEFCRRQST